jgi:ankyrin repeat protein
MRPRITGTYPRGFDRWDLRDNKGGTGAHWAAAFGRLPLAFELLELKDKDGVSVAHEAAKAGSLPP